MLETNRRRDNLCGKLHSRDWKWGGAEREAYQDKHSEKPQNGTHRTDARSRGSKWENWSRRCLAPNERDERDKECFYNRRGGVAEDFSGKSQFNKDRWLPLVYTPFLITHMCCHKTKKQPLHEYQNKHKYAPILATLAEESRVRKQGWIRTGCNAFDSKNPKSQPLSFWTEQDILTYIVKYGLEIASVYGDIVSVDEANNEYPPIDVLGNVGCNLKCTGCDRTGCVFCAFGFHLEKGETRFQRLAKTHPKQYEYAIGGGQWSDNPFYDPVAPEYDGEWKNWNPKKIWTPSKKGLGMGKVFDMANEIYGKDFYRYD